MSYGTLEEAAARLDAAVAARYPNIDEDARAEFPAAVLTKLAMVYEEGGKARLHTESGDGWVGWRALLIDDNGWC
jgi:hypothetical protein